MQSRCLVLISSLLVLISCAPKATETAAHSVPPIAFDQNEYDSDLSLLSRSETQLISTGLRFSFTNDGKVNWDLPYADQVTRRGSTSNRNKIDALVIFSGQAERFLEKYKGEFALRNRQGFATPKKLDAQFQISLENKIRLAKIMAAELRLAPSGPTYEIPWP